MLEISDFIDVLVVMNVCDCGGGSSLLACSSTQVLSRMVKGQKETTGFMNVVEV